MVDEKAAGLGADPEALRRRQTVVTLSDGSTVVVHKWSDQKSIELLSMVGLLPHVPVIAEQSVAESDRERVRAMDFDDKMAISTAASALNVTPSILKNLEALLLQRKGLEAALVKDKPQSPLNQP